MPGFVGTLTNPPRDDYNSHERHLPAGYARRCVEALFVRRASIAMLKAHLSEYVDAARAGEEVIVTDRNKPVARLGPVSVLVRGEAHLIELIRAGLVRPAGRSLPRKFWQRRRPQDPQSRALAALIEDRAEGR